MPLVPRTQVAFTFLNDGKEWHGGLNYFRSLFHALGTTPDAGIAPVAFVGMRTDVARLNLPKDVRVVRDSVLDRKSVKWFLDKLGARMLGVPWLSNQMLRAQRIEVLSHAGPTGHPALRNIAWIPDFQHMHLPVLPRKGTANPNRALPGHGRTQRPDRAEQRSGPPRSAKIRPRPDQ